MKPPRVFVGAPCALSVEVKLDEQDAHHLRDVLRMQVGDQLVVVSNRVAWDARITAMAKGAITATIIHQSPESSSELPIELTILQALPKGTKMDSIIEKVVELGASRIVPVRSVRSYVGEPNTKLSRWRRIACSAAQQAQRMVVPEVTEPKAFNAAISQFASSGHVIVASELAPPRSLEIALERETHAPIALAIGPEGSFTEEELHYATDAGCDLASLGPTILRTETAAPAMIAAIAALRRWW